MRIPAALSVLALALSIGAPRAVAAADPGADSASAGLYSRLRPLKVLESRGFSGWGSTPNRVLIIFFASWCPPCREELPRLAKTLRSLSKTVQIVGVAVEDDPVKAARFSSEVHWEFPLMIGKSDAIEIMQGTGNDLAAIPYVLLVDSHGIVAAHKKGKITPSGLTKLVETSNKDARS